MREGLSLRQKLLLLAGIPLAAATVFALVSAYQSASVALVLREAAQHAQLARSVARLTQAAENDAAAYAAGTGARSTTDIAAQLADVRRHTDHLRKDAADIHTWLATLISASTRVQEQRIAAGDGDGAAGIRARAQYAHVNDAAAALVRALGATSDDRNLRSRFQELSWLIEIADANAGETLMVQANYGGTRVGATVLEQMYAHAAHRQFAVQQLLQACVAERRGPLDALLGAPTTKTAETMAAEWREKAVFGAPAVFVTGTETEWRAAISARAGGVAAEMGQSGDGLVAAAEVAAAEAARGFFGLCATLVAILGVSLVVARYLLRRIHGTLRQTLQSLSKGAQQIDVVVEEATESGKRLTDAATKQATALEETSSALQQLGGMNRQNAGTAQTSSTQMGEIAALLTKASEAMQRLVDTMSRISQTSDQTQKIIKTISEIAFQTNILALNASIEAARAGEAGSGFKVVADEIRELAKRAADASTETDRIILRSHATIVQSSELCGRVDGVFHGVQANADSSRQLIEQIRAASEEVTRGIEHIQIATQQMNQMMTQNVGIADENVSTTQALLAESKQLTDTIARLDELVTGAMRLQPA